eukprot:SAG31_NODE_8062_length_1530_cov_1.897275_1_plen_90_part_00
MGAPKRLEFPCKNALEIAMSAKEHAAKYADVKLTAPSNASPRSSPKLPLFPEHRSESSSEEESSSSEPSSEDDEHDSTEPSSEDDEHET